MQGDGDLTWESVCLGRTSDESGLLDLESLEDDLGWVCILGCDLDGSPFLVSKPGGRGSWANLASTSLIAPCLDGPDWLSCIKGDLFPSFGGVKDLVSLDWEFCADILLLLLSDWCFPCDWLWDLAGVPADSLLDGCSDVLERGPMLWLSGFEVNILEADFAFGEASFRPCKEISLSFPPL